MNKRLMCPVCGAPSHGGDAIGDSTVFICPQCGGYRLAGTVITLFEKGTLAKPDPVSFRELVERKRGTSSEYPVITSGDIDGLLLEKLVEFVGQDPRLEHIDVTSQPAQFRILIGGQKPFWEFQVPVQRLRKGNLPVYAVAIVDRWEGQRP